METSSAAAGRRAGLMQCERTRPRVGRRPAQTTMGRRGRTEPIQSFGEDHRVRVSKSRVSRPALSGDASARRKAVSHAIRKSAASWSPVHVASSGRGAAASFENLSFKRRCVSASRESSAEHMNASAST